MTGEREFEDLGGERMHAGEVVDVDRLEDVIARTRDAKTLIGLLVLERRRSRQTST